MARALSHHQLKRISQRRLVAWRRIAAQLEALRVVASEPVTLPDIPPHIRAAVEANWRQWFGDRDAVATLTVEPPASPALPPTPTRTPRPVRPRPALIDLSTAPSSVEAQAESWRNK